MLRGQVQPPPITSGLSLQLTSLFAILALVIASVGLYGVMSYFVARRTAGNRIRHVVPKVPEPCRIYILGGALFQVLLGLALGIPAALLAGHFMASQLYGVGSEDHVARDRCNYAARQAAFGSIFSTAMPRRIH